MNLPPDIENKSVDAPTLRDLLDEGLLPIGLALEIARQVLRLLGSEQGSIQRDISPESLILTRDSAGAPLVKLTDSGIDPEVGPGVTEESPASDIHSFGVLLYELLTGTHPFQGQTAEARPGQPRPSPLDFEVSDRAGRIPPDLRALVLTAIAEDPEGRFASAEEMDAELARIQTRFPLDASPTIALGSLPPRASWIGARSPGQAEPPGSRRRPGRLRLSTRLGASIVLALLLLVLLAGFRFLLQRKDEPRTAAVSEPARESVAPTAAATLPDAPRVRREPLAGPADPRQVTTESVTREPARKPARRKDRSAQRPAPSPERRQAPEKPKIRVAGGREFFDSEPAILRSLPAASYPAAALGTGTRAEIVVGVTVDETGAVRDPRIESSRVQGSAPESVFREAALAAARRARFEPAREGGRPVRSTSTLTFTFGIER